MLPSMVTALAILSNRSFDQDLPTTPPPHPHDLQGQHGNRSDPQLDNYYNLYKKGKKLYADQTSFNVARVGPVRHHKQRLKNKNQRRVPVKRRLSLRRNKPFKRRGSYGQTYNKGRKLNHFENSLYDDYYYHDHSGTGSNLAGNSPDRNEYTTPRGVNKYWNDWFGNTPKPNGHNDKSVEDQHQEYHKQNLDNHDDERHTKLLKFKRKKQSKPHQVTFKPLSDLISEEQEKDENSNMDVIDANSPANQQVLEASPSHAQGSHQYPQTIYNSYHISLPGLDGKGGKVEERSFGLDNGVSDREPRPFWQNTPDSDFMSFNDEPERPPRRPRRRRRKFHDRHEEHSDSKHNIFVIPHSNGNDDRRVDHLIDRMEDTLDSAQERAGYRHKVKHHPHPPVKPNNNKISLLHTLPFALALPIVLGISALIYSTSTNDNSPTINVSVNNTAISDSDSSSSSGGGGGNNATAFFPIFIFPNGTVAFPVFTTLIDLTNLLGLFNTTQRSFDENGWFEQDDELLGELGDFAPDLDFGDFNFNPFKPIGDLLDIGVIDLWRRAKHFWSDINLVDEGLSDGNGSCIEKELCTLHSKDPPEIRDNSVLTSAKLATTWWKESYRGMSLQATIQTLLLGKYDACEYIICST